MTAPIRQIRFRWRGGSRNTRFRSRAHDLRSARNPVGSSSPRRRRPAERWRWTPGGVGTHHRGDLAVPQAGRSAAYFAATASISSTLGAGHGPFGGSPTRWRAIARVLKLAAGVMQADYGSGVSLI